MNATDNNPANVLSRDVPVAVIGLGTVSYTHLTLPPTPYV